MDLNGYISEDKKLKMVQLVWDIHREIQTANNKALYTPKIEYKQQNQKYTKATIYRQLNSAFNRIDILVQISGTNRYKQVKINKSVANRGY